MKLSMLFIIVLLSSCGKNEPIQITESQQQYVGVWQYLYESKTENSLDVKNILLAIYSDSTAVYRQCIVSKTETVGENSSSSSRSANNVSLPTAYITALTKSKITLEQEVGPVSFDYDITINKVPYVENGRWFIDIEDTKLTKLEGSEIDELTSWECPETDSASSE